MTHIRTHSFWLPKAGNAADEYEDAFRLSPTFGHASRLAFAIADGATESLLSRNWANLLVKRFVRHWHASVAWDVWLTHTLRAWENEKREYIKRRERSHKPILWYEEPGLEAGAFAALLGLIITRSPNEFTWDALAVGDCCMAHLRADQVLCAFPLTDSNDYNSRPFLLSSNPGRNRALEQQLHCAVGSARGGDHFYLMTDALAAWFLRAREQGETPWQSLNSLQTAPAFAAWINDKRTAREMRNDDVTLLHLELVD